jgi:hypothetical protein
VARLTVQTTSKLVATVPQVKKSTCKIQRRFIQRAPSQTKSNHDAKFLFNTNSGFDPLLKKKDMEILGILQGSTEMIFPNSSNKLSEEVLKATKSIRSSIETIL